jgi:hypothetical protein
MDKPTNENPFPQRRAFHVEIYEERGWIMVSCQICRKNIAHWDEKIIPLTIAEVIGRSLAEHTHQTG